MGEAASQFRYTVVVPVYNEGANIATTVEEARRTLPGEYEFLIVYDFDEDNTLPAVAKIPADKRPEHLRLVKNTLGRGVRYAIEAGMRAAQAPIVVVMMADLSDDLPKVGEMVRRAENGAAVVAASRYMEGGYQFGGPWLKGMMSRTAGLTLHHIAGLPTHDPTNSFKAYRKDFLDTQKIETEAGFALGLELTAKAHASGRRVEEIPASWYDRTAGESRFRLMKWMPVYLKWYFYAMINGRR